jgi:hypothetical protein
MRRLIRHLWIGVLAIALLAAAPTVTVPLWADGHTGTIGDPVGDPGTGSGGNVSGDPDVPTGKGGGGSNGVSRYSGLSFRSAQPAAAARPDLWRIQLLVRWLWLANHRAF